MYGITIVTPPATVPVTAAELRSRLRLNDDSEDADLTEFLASAVELFEHDTNRPILSTAYRQDLSAWPCSGEIVLGVGGVTSVTAVKRYLADGSTETLAADQWRAVLLTPPARVRLAAIPATVTTATGISVSPVGCVEYVAGWANAAAVPKQLVTALKLMAGHWYENREAYTTDKLNDVPDGWKRVVSRFRLGLSGDWGQ